MTIAFRSIGARSAGAISTVSVTLPAGDAAGDMLVAGRCAWMAGAVLTAEATWTAGGKLEGGTGTAADAHVTVVGIDYKEATGSDTDPTVFDQATATGGCGVCAAYSKTETTWDTAATATGDDATHGADRSVTASASMSFQPGDMLVAVAACDTDAAVTITAQTLSASGITFGATTSQQTTATGVTTGNDGNVFLFDASVTAGTGTVAPTLAFTATASQCGPVSFIRLREVVPAAAVITVPTLQPRIPT